jgi:hypothetical protein
LNNDQFVELGFTNMCITNKRGVQVYPGQRDDWAVVVPSGLVSRELKEFMNGKPVTFYGLHESHAYRIAKQYS